MKQFICVLLAIILCCSTLSACIKPNTQKNTTTGVVTSTVRKAETTTFFKTKEALNAMSAIKDVIVNKTKYLCTENNQFVYLKDPHSDNYLIINDKGLNEYTNGAYEKVNYVFTHFCVIDIDSDGNPEILLQSEESNIFIFHYEDNVVYCYVFPFKGMENLKKDCSFISSGGAGYQLVEKIIFLKGKCINKELCLFDGLTDAYHINGRSVKQVEAEEYIKNQDKKGNAEWYVLNEINIEKYINVG